MSKLSLTLCTFSITDSVASLFLTYKRNSIRSSYFITILFIQLLILIYYGPYYT